MDLIPQEVFSLVENLLQGSGVNLTATHAINSTASAIGGTAATSPLASFLSLFLSFSAITDWLKLFFLGGILETGRRWLFWAYYKLVDSFFVTVYIDENDDAHAWILYWVSKQANYSMSLLYFRSRR